MYQIHLITIRLYAEGKMPDFWFARGLFCCPDAALPLLVAQAVYGVEAGGAEGGVEAEEDADNRAEPEGDQHGGRGHEDGPFVDVADKPCAEHP